MAETPPQTVEEFLASLEDYVPTIPDELTAHHLARSGFQCPDVRIVRLVSVAAQKFIGEVASDALQYCKIRQAAAAKEARGRGVPAKVSSAVFFELWDKRLVLTTEDLACALKEYGVHIKRQEYFADTPGAAAAVTGPKDKGPK
eukprot:jgi/Mesen1/4599/ME000232S03851